MIRTFLSQPPVVLKSADAAGSNVGLSMIAIAGFLFVLRAFGRIQIHRQIWNFREQYKIGRRLLIIRPGSKSTKASVLIALFYGNLTKKEKEKSKWKEENGDRRQKD